MIWSPLAVAFLLTATALLLLRKGVGPFRILDVPNERSSHRRPVPRTGGLGVAIGILGAVGFSALIGGSLTRASWVVLAWCLTVAAVGLLDDVFGLPIRPRLAVQIVAALGLVTMLGGLRQLPLPPPFDIQLPLVLGILLSILWLVAVTNFFNFMDGIDGIAGGQALVTCTTLAILGSLQAQADLMVLSAVFIASLAVFLMFNWAPASIFLGDAGSFFVGFFLAASPWLVRPEMRERTLFLVAASLFLFLADPAWTLVQRWRRGARLGQAHRDHLYQRLVQTTPGHGAVALGLVGAAIVLSIVALSSFLGSATGWMVFLTMVLAFSFEFSLTQHRMRRSRLRDAADGANRAQRTSSRSPSQDLERERGTKSP